MDAFYAAVEQRDNPQYRGKPLIVGGDPDKRGVVATCSYEARKFGIHSAMSSARARTLCPHATFLRPRFEVYRQVSRQIQAIFQDYTDLIEPLSLDEAYLDVTDCPLFSNSATLIARDIKRRIREEIELTASSGVSYNKFLAKIASDMNKPDGSYVITPEQGESFVAMLPIGRFHGVGKATERKMKALGIHTGADLKTWSMEGLQRHFGKTAAYYYNACRGIDERPVVSHRECKSIGSETTFEHDLYDREEMLDWLERLATEVVELMAIKHFAAHTVTIKVKYDNFQQVTRSRTVDQPLACIEGILALLPDLLAKTEAAQRPVRLLGVTVSGLIKVSDAVRYGQQMGLF